LLLKQLLPLGRIYNPALKSTKMQEIEFILYVEDQEKSKSFYELLLLSEPALHVPGMTEFKLAESVKLGLMPEKGMAKILGDQLPSPVLGNGIPRCELYLKVDDPQAYLDRGILNGGLEISKVIDRDWGDSVGYMADLDGHVLAFAKSM
jgi:predicted enzyme related to lactoylglutathione lyase